ncbi:MAG TPA: hypothetical protein DCQ31_18350 [Bacteroidales bacterium]|nr:hypothetical protein [Bacteroidales bacterium]
MKRTILYLFAAVTITMASMVSCSEEAENLAPTFSKVELAAGNKTATVTLSEPVYATPTKTGNLTKDNVMVTIEGVNFTYEIKHVAGEDKFVVELTVTSVTQGTEVIKVAPKTGTSIYDAEGKAMTETALIASSNLGKNLGIIGKWYSSKTNVAPLLVTYFKVDSIFAEFKADKTYEVKQFNKGNITTTPDVLFKGTYTIAKSTVAEIWTIVIAQELPYAAAASGIFEIKTGPEVLWYEVAQTSGTQNVPATPAGGFGSTNGGTLGVLNVQKYIRIN